MPWCPRLTASCVPGCSICSFQAVDSHCYMSECERAASWDRERPHQILMCLCLLSLCGPKSWCKDLFCLLPVPPSHVPLLPTSQTSPDPSLFSSFPSLSLIWYVQWCDKTKREVFECTNTPFGGTPAREESVKESKNSVGRPRCQDWGKRKLRRKK